MRLSPLRPRPLLTTLAVLGLTAASLTSCQSTSAGNGAPGSSASSGDAASTATSTTPAPANVIQVTSTKDFDARVAAASGTVVVDCFATWCGPCSALTPELDAVAAAHPGLTVLRVDIDAQPELAARFKADSIPLLVVIKHGKIQGQQLGYQDRTALSAWLGG